MFTKELSAYIKDNNPFLLGFGGLLAFAYFWGVVSFQHYIPGSSGFYVGLYVMLSASIGIFIGLLKMSATHCTHNVMAWLLFFVLMLLQPILNSVVYFDDHLLLCMLFLWCAVLAMAVGNLSLEQKQKAVHWMAISLLMAAVCTVLSQFGQLFFRYELSGLLIFIGTEDRLVGNVAQVNQAAYIATMGIASIFYFLKRLSAMQWWHWLIAAGLMILFGVGLGFSASRGGILLAVAALCSAGIFYKDTLKKRVVMSVIFAPMVIVGYNIGTFLMNKYLNTELSAVGRLVGENSLHLRESLLEHAWLAFSSSPITGIGFYNFKSFGLANAESLSWFTVAHHAHNLIAQMAAELGILGLALLGYFAFILIKNLRFDFTPDKALAYAILMLTFLYSLSEFPLWYIKYLVIAVFFLAIIDGSSFKLKFDFRNLLLVLSMAYAMCCVYYIKDYQIYSNIAYNVIDGKKELAMEKLQKAPNTFGFGSYRDLTLYQIVPANEDNLQQMIAMGERVLSVHYDDFLILKQAQMLAIVGEEERADKYFRSLCLLGSNGSFCQDAIDNLYAMSELEPEMAGYLERFEKWYVEKFNKPMPERTEKADELIQQAQE